MEEYSKELERLIIDVLLPVYVEHARLTGRKDALKAAQPSVVPIHNMQPQTASVMPMKRRA